MSLWVIIPHQGIVHSNLPGIAFGAFSFSWSYCSCCPNFFRSTAEWFLLGRELPLFLMGTPVSCPPESLTDPSLGKDFFLLGRLLKPAVSLRSLLTNSSLEKIIFSGFGQRVRWAFHSILLRRLLEILLFLIFGVFHLSPHTPLNYYCCFLKVQEQFQLAVSFPPSSISFVSLAF